MIIFGSNRPCLPLTRHKLSQTTQTIYGTYWYSIQCRHSKFGKDRCLKFLGFFFFFIILADFCRSTTTTLQTNTAVTTRNSRKAQYTPPTLSSLVASASAVCMSEFATTADGFGDANAQRSHMGHDCRRVCSHRRHDETVACEFVYTPPTRRDSTVSSRRRRRCVLGLTEYNSCGRPALLHCTN